MQSTSLLIRQAVFSQRVRLSTKKVLGLRLLFEQERDGFGIRTILYPFGLIAGCGEHVDGSLSCSQQ